MNTFLLKPKKQKKVTEILVALLDIRNSMIKEQEKTQ